MATKTDTGWVMYVNDQPSVYIHGARAPVYRTWTTGTGEPASWSRRNCAHPFYAPGEGPQEYEPIDPGSEGVSYILTPGLKVPAGHVAAQERPQWFAPCDPP
jgi:hypothetical protein